MPSFCACLRLALLLSAAAGMFFTTDDSHPTWDTWSFYEPGLPLGPYFEFYLAAQQTTGTWSGFGVATSPDGVHWEDQGLVVTRDANATGGYLGTGSVWRAPPNATFRYIVNYSQQFGAPATQHIFFAVSNDLVSWQRLGWSDVFAVNASAGYTSGRWDCIYAIDDPALPGSGAKLGYFTAVPLGNRSGFGLGASRDGVTWTALPPLLLQGGGNVEVGAVEALRGGGGRYYAAVGAAGQMLTYTAESPAGPFALAATNPNLLGFRTAQSTYFVRFFPTAPGPRTLATHQWISRTTTWFGRRCFLPPLKAAAVDAAGVLRLAWWPGNEAARGGALPFAPEPTPFGDVALALGVFNVTQGVLLEADVNASAAAAYGGAGLFVQTADGGGVALLVTSASGAGAIGRVSSSGQGFAPEEAWDRALPLPPGGVARMRVLLRWDMLELYVQDALIATYAAAAFPTGRLGVLDPAAGVAGGAAVAGAAAWALTLGGSGLAYRAPALASSEYQPGGDAYAAFRATDGDPGSRWSSGLPYARGSGSGSGSSTAWLRVDLGSAQRVAAIVIKWQERVAYARAYSLGCSAEGQQWSTLYATASGGGGVERVGGLDAQCRFVLLNCTQPGPQNGYSVYELEVHGE
jgi:hypothetical protein